MLAKEMQALCTLSPYHTLPNVPFQNKKLLTPEQVVEENRWGTS